MSDRYPLDPDQVRLDQWYQFREFCSKRDKRGLLRISRSTFLNGVRDGIYPAGRPTGPAPNSLRVYYGAQILALREGKDWREVEVPEEVTL